jgi:hypothetical protein
MFIPSDKLEPAQVCVNKGFKPFFRNRIKKLTIPKRPHMKSYSKKDFGLQYLSFGQLLKIGIDSILFIFYSCFQEFSRSAISRPNNTIGFSSYLILVSAIFCQIQHLPFAVAYTEKGSSFSKILYQ